MRCNICYISIKEHQNDVKCPRCMNAYHFDHLAAWLLTEKICPICREELSPEFREEFRPKSERDREKLLRIQRNLSSLSSTVGNWEKKNKKQLGKQYERERRARGDGDDDRPKKKIIVPLVIFGVWMILLIVFLA